MLWDWISIYNLLFPFWLNLGFTESFRGFFGLEGFEGPFVVLIL